MKKKYQRGYTSGVYDMFHIGHLNILRTSKSLCEELIVGVTTDELVQKRKNKVPVIPLDERMQIVDALTCVDKVVMQENMDKMAMVVALGCDVVFVGDDWKGHSTWIKYEKEFNAIGVDVVYLPYTQGTSSTKLQLVLDKIMID